MFKKILVPLDFTEKNKRALQVARELATRHSASITLLHVIERVEHIAPEELQEFYGRLERTAREMIDQAAQPLRRRKMKLHEDVVYGKRIEEIVRFAEQNKIDLIVLSSHKISPGQNWGTLSHQVAIVAPCAVLLVK